MPDIKFNCKYCSQPLEAPSDMRGQIIECHSVNTHIAVLSVVIGFRNRETNVERLSYHWGASLIPHLVLRPTHQTL